MLTKTGLRPREPRSGGNRGRPSSGLPEQDPPGIGKKLPPVVYTPYPNKCRGGALATARMIRARRQTTGTISNFPCGGTQMRPRGRDKTPAGGSGRSRSSGSRSRGRVEAGAERSRPARSRPEWDDSLGDPSRYKLTPEEAVQRKKSLVSKHNTLVFGLGGHGRDRDDSTPNAQMAATAAAAAAAARVRSAKKIEQGARKLVDEPRHSRRSRRAGTAGVAELNPAGDLTVSGTGPEGTEVGEINDLTVTLYPARRSSREQEHREGLAGSAAGGGAVAAAFVRGCKAGGERGGGNVAADDGAEVSGLAGIEVGIKAFSERVWRLETYRRAGLAGGASAGKEKADENGVLEGGSRACSAESDKENIAAEAEEEREMSSGDERMTTAGEITACNIYGGGPPSRHDGEVAATDLYHGEGATTLDDSDGQGAERRRPHNDSGRHRAGPWSPPSLDTGEPSIAAAAALSSGRDEKEAVDLVERIQLLEAQILRLRLLPPSALTADFGAAQVKGAGDEGLGAAGEGETDGGGAGRPGATAGSMEDMRVVIADLLSLTAALLQRATAAELRLRKLTAGAADQNGGGEVEKAGRANDRLDVQKAADVVAHRVRARAESAVLDYSRKVPFEAEEEETAVIVATGVHSDGATVDAVGRDIPSSCSVDGARSGSSSSFSPLEAASPCVGRGPRRVGPLQQLRMTSAASACTTAIASPSAKDCWGLALDAVGQLVDGDDENAPGIPVTPSEACSPRLWTNFREMETLPPLQRDVPAAVSVATALSPVRATRAYDSERPTGSFARRPPSPLRAAPVATRRWGAWDVLAPLGTPRAPWGSSGGGVSATPRDDRVASAGLRTPEGLQGNEDKGENEDARSEPSFLAPTPEMKPQHPFERTPPMRSPRWLRGRVGRLGGETGGVAAGADAAAPAFTVGRGGREGSSDESGRDKLRAAKASPAIGQWYTPARSREVSVSAGAAMT